MARASLQASMHDFANLALVAPQLKVLYLPTPKAACTTLKLMLAEAAGTHQPEMADRLAIMHVSRAQTIHHPAVHGLTRFADLHGSEQRTILDSSDWLRVTSVRDPIARAYSAWENRIFMRAHRRTQRIIELAHDVDTDGSIDLAASFAHFSEALATETETFMVDHHFWPQSRVVRPDIIDFSHIVRVDRVGEIDQLTALISHRSGKRVTASRLNEGLGVKVERVCDRSTADRLMQVYRTDYDTLGFERREWPHTVGPVRLSDIETRLVHQYRNLFERGISVARESQRRTGARYGMAQMRRALSKRFSGSNDRNPKDVQP